MQNCIKKEKRKGIKDQEEANLDQISTKATSNQDQPQITHNTGLNKITQPPPTDQTTGFRKDLIILRRSHPTIQESTRN